MGTLCHSNKQTLKLLKKKKKKRNKKKKKNSKETELQTLRGEEWQRKRAMLAFAPIRNFTSIC